jgi:hypothetical protein
MRNTLPTSYEFITRSLEEGPLEKSTDAKDGKTNFISSFELVGTSDSFSFVTLADAIRWRQRVSGSEEEFRVYCI